MSQILVSKAPKKFLNIMKKIVLHTSEADPKPGVISRGDQGGGAPLLKFLLMLGGLSPPKTLPLAWLFRVYWPCFLSAMINCALLYGY